MNPTPPPSAAPEPQCGGPKEAYLEPGCGECGTPAGNPLDLVGFAKAIMKRWPEGGMDGFELQEIAEEHGLLVETRRTTFCASGDDSCNECPCREAMDDKEAARGFSCYRRRSLGAKASPPTAGDGWTKTPPTKQGLYWHWNNNEDDAPVPLHVLMCGTGDKCFVATGQMGLTHAINCEDYGGWWMPCPEPRTPEVRP